MSYLFLHESDYNFAYLVSSTSKLVGDKYNQYLRKVIPNTEMEMTSAWLSGRVAEHCSSVPSVPCALTPALHDAGRTAVLSLPVSKMPSASRFSKQGFASIRHFLVEVKSQHLALSHNGPLWAATQTQVHGTVCKFPHFTSPSWQQLFPDWPSCTHTVLDFWTDPGRAKPRPNQAEQEANFAGHGSRQMGRGSSSVGHQPSVLGKFLSLHLHKTDKMVC